MSMTALQFCHLVENRLGWSPHPKAAPLKVFRSTALVVTEKIETNPTLYTWHNLLLAVELLASERETRSPMGVFAHVERALLLSRVDGTDTDAKIQHAIKVERHRGDPDGWIVRFARASGRWRTEAYEEWAYQEKLQAPLYAQVKR